MNWSLSHCKYDFFPSTSLVLILKSLVGCHQWWRESHSQLSPIVWARGESLCHRMNEILALAWHAVSKYGFSYYLLWSFIEMCDNMSFWMCSMRQRLKVKELKRKPIILYALRVFFFFYYYWHECLYILFYLFHR